MKARVLALASVTEAGTGLVLMIAPGTAAALLLGTGLPGVAALIARCFGPDKAWGCRSTAC
jgi:hypothetical protein